MGATFDLPLTIRDLPPEVLRWLLVKSAESGKSTDEVTRDLLTSAARHDNPGPRLLARGKAGKGSSSSV